MKLYPNENRSINRICNEFIRMVNEDRNQLPSASDAKMEIDSIQTRIADVRDSFIIKAADLEDHLPAIYEDNQGQLLSASIGLPRKLIEAFADEEGEMRNASDAREALALSIRSLEIKASEELKDIYNDWQEKVRQIEHV